MKPVDIVIGDSPIILAMPHSGLFVPDDIYARLNARGRALADTDWHVDRLYAGLLPNATMIRANFHRYVIDPNRDPEGGSLYPGQNTTGLCPLTNFDGLPLYKKNQAPDNDEIAARLAGFHAPYHAAIGAQIARVKARHGIALLYDCHSIRSAVPYLFDGVLPDFNIGTNSGKSCAPELTAAVETVCKSAANYSHVTNGRFKGGWTTRHYGRPETSVHAVQMELSQDSYMQSGEPWVYDEPRASQVQIPLKTILNALETTLLKGITP